jgi:hypothetical protein
MNERDLQDREKRLNQEYKKARLRVRQRSDERKKFVISVGVFIYYFISVGVFIYYYIIIFHKCWRIYILLYYYISPL